MNLLRYFHKVSRHGITVDKETYMVGSYAPKTELQSYQTPLEEAPSGKLGVFFSLRLSLSSDDGFENNAPFLQLEDMH